MAWRHSGFSKSHPSHSTFFQFTTPFTIFLPCLWDGLRFQFFPSNQVSSPVIPTFKDPPASAGDEEDSGSIPGLGRSSGGGKGNPLQYSCLGNPMGRVAWWVTVQEGATKSQTRLSDFTFTFHFLHWRRKWQLTPVFLPGESQGRGSLVGCRLWGGTG